MATQNFLQASMVPVDRDGNDWVINVIPPRPSKKLNLEFLGDDGFYYVTVEDPILPRKYFNWPLAEDTSKHQCPLGPAGNNGVRRCEVLASLEPQEHYVLRISHSSKANGNPSSLSHLYLSFTDVSGKSSPIGFVGLDI